jgi:hypothetical protein
MFANDNEFYTYGGLVARTDAFQPPAENSVLGYEKYWYGTAGKQFTSGFLSGTTTNGTTRYVSYGAGVSVPSENLGFYFSGMRSKSSGPIFYTTSNAALNADTISNTLISVDMTTQRSEKWTNQTLPTYVPGRANAELVWVPVGKKGVLIAIGGVIQPEFAFANHSLNANQTAESVRLSRHTTNLALLTHIFSKSLAQRLCLRYPSTILTLARGMSKRQKAGPAS